MYAPNVAIIKWGTSLKWILTLTRGIRQGCPCSAALWAILFDPFLRAIAAVLLPATCTITAYMDDLAIVFRDLVRYMPLVLCLFTLLKGAAGLEVHCGKTQIMFVGRKHAAHRASLIRKLPVLSTALFRSFVKYLGILIGEGAASLAWTEIGSKMVARSHDIKAMSEGLGHELMWYNVLVASVTSFVAGAFHIDASLSFTEARCHAICFGFPMHAVSREVFCNLKLLKAPLECYNLRLLSRVIKYRLAITTPGFADVCNMIDDMRSSDERRMVASLPFGIPAP